MTHNPILSTNFSPQGLGTKAPKDPIKICQLDSGWICPFMMDEGLKSTNETCVEAEYREIQLSFKDQWRTKITTKKRNWRRHDRREREVYWWTRTHWGLDSGFEKYWRGANCPQKLFPSVRVAIESQLLIKKGGWGKQRPLCNAERRRSLADNKLWALFL